MYKCVICDRKVDKSKASTRMIDEHVCLKCLKEYVLKPKEVTNGN